MLLSPGEAAGNLAVYYLNQDESQWFKNERTPYAVLRKKRSGSECMCPRIPLDSFAKHQMMVGSLAELNC